MEADNQECSDPQNRQASPPRWCNLGVSPESEVPKETHAEQKRRC